MSLRTRFYSKNQTDEKVTLIYFCENFMELINLNPFSFVHCQGRKTYGKSIWPLDTTE